MTRGIFIAGNESVLLSAAEAEAEKRVELYAEALIPDPFPVPGASDQSLAGRDSPPAEIKTSDPVPSKKIPLSWNPGSPISSRTLMLAAENRLGRINDALLVCSPPSVYRSAEALDPGEIETLVNSQIKGWFFLVRELALYFRSRMQGTLSLVVPETGPVGGRDSPADLLGPSASASFRALAQGLISSSVVEPFQIFGFSLPETGKEQDFAAWLFRILDEGDAKKSGKWHKFGGFSFLR